jgi:hypothetical protein
MTAAKRNIERAGVTQNQLAFTLKWSVAELDPHAGISAKPS